MTNSTMYKDIVSNWKGKKSALTSELENQKRELASIRSSIEIVSEANWLLGEAISKVQTSFKTTVEKLVTSSIRSIYERDITFSLELEQRGKGLECKPITKEDGEEFELDGEIGGGLLDLISFTSKIIFWKIQGQGRPIFILDEPFRFLGHGSVILLVGKLLRKLSVSLGLQFIIVSHEDELSEIADRSFTVTHRNGIAKVLQNVKKTV